MESSAALVLAGHGSSDDPRCAAPVWRHARELALKGPYLEVACVFWKQPPFFADVYDVTSAALIVVVPMMTAAGYYARTVLPRQMRAGSPPPGRRLLITEPLGVQAEMAGLLEAQAIATARDGGVETSRIQLLVVGHGTRRDPLRSGASTHDHVAALRRRGAFASVHAAFLEQDPQVAAALESLPGDGPVVVVPNLIADGGHALRDIPGALGLPAETRHALAGSRRVLFAPSVGERSECVGLVLRLAGAALGRAHAAQGSRP
jgi:sirohydrochlorin cobaltochelatase